jgi:group I intron endonuclease
MEQIKSKPITSDMKYPGIYLIINLYNNKFYVGSSVNLQKRKEHHFGDLKSNKHKNKHLQSAYNKYGKEYFIMVMIEKVEDKNNLTEREQYWIDSLDACNRDIAYNICPTAGNQLGFKHSEETIAKLKEIKGEKASMYGKNHTKEAIKNMSKPVIQCALDGTYIKEWEGGSLAAKILELNSSTISGCCRFRYKYHGDYLWFYKEYYESSDFNIDNHIPNIGKRINQYSLDGEFIKTWDSYRDIRKIYDINQTVFIRCCEGKAKTHHGFIWQYAS